MKDHVEGAKSILLVEDEPTIRTFCRRVLGGCGLEIDIAENGKVAQDKIAERYYDLCLIDMRTPLVSGEELFIWLLQEHPCMAGRVIFTTGDIMGGETERFVERTSRPFLTKPFNAHELEDIITKTLAETE